jgi:hypothetical protein
MGRTRYLVVIAIWSIMRLRGSVLWRVPDISFVFSLPPLWMVPVAKLLRADGDHPITSPNPAARDCQTPPVWHASLRASARWASSASPPPVDPDRWLFVRLPACAVFGGALLQQPDHPLGTRMLCSPNRELS